MTPTQPTQPTQPTEANATATPLTPAQLRYVEAVHARLCKIFGYKIAKAHLRGHQPSDIANFTIQKVIRNVTKFMATYPTPDHCANAVATNSFHDYCRRENAQRGHGARATRTVIGDEPVTNGETDAVTVLERHPGNVVDPEEWVERDYHQGILGEIREQMSDLAWEGLILTVFHGLTQEEAAERLGVGREHLNREINKGKKIARQMLNDNSWEVE